MTSIINSSDDQVMRLIKLVTSISNSIFSDNHRYLDKDSSFVQILENVK